MSPLALTSTQLGTDSWGIADDADRRFCRILAQVSVPMLAFLVVARWLPLTPPPTPAQQESPRHYVELLPETKMPVPKPPAPIQAEAEPKPGPLAQQKPEPPPKTETAAKPKPAPDPEAQKAAARAAAERAGIAAIRDQLADMRASEDAALDSNRALHNASSTPTSTAQPDILRSARSTSSGAGSAGVRAASSAQSHTALADHRTAAVQAPVSSRLRPSSEASTSGGIVAARTLEEIQLAFDRSKGAFYAIFNRAARSDPSVKAGTIVVSLTIAPDGTVTDCRVVSSNFRNQDLHNRVLQRIKLLKFDARPVPAFTYPNYPINYLPS